MKRSALFMILSIFIVTCGWANPNQEKPLQDAILDAQKRAVVQKNISLSEIQAKSFWSLYEDYQKELDKLNAQTRSLAQTFFQNYNNMTDEVASQLIHDYQTLDEERQKIKARYVKKFKSALPPKIVARYFQIENKFESEFRMKLSHQIPLLK